MSIHNVWMKRIGTIVMTAFLFVSAPTGYVVGASGSQEVSKVSMPRTAEEHRAMAQRYRLRATDYQRDAEKHQAMCDGYGFEVSIPENPMVAGASMMEAKKYCDRYVRDTMDFARNARELAAYHTARANTLSGQ